MRARTTATVGLVAVLSGCSATPAPLGTITQTPSPRREALQYFPVGAPVVALVKTDPTEPAVRRLAGSDVLAPLRAWAAAEGLRYRTLRILLGNEAVVGEPHLGAPPLLVLVTEDGGALDGLARARADAGQAISAGEYRGAALYDDGTWAFAVRGPVLIVGATLNDVRAALDQRTQDGALSEAALDAPDGAEDDAARGAIDVAALLAYAPAVWRTLPLAQALDDPGAFTLRAGPSGRVVASVDLPVDDPVLLPQDLPARGIGPVVLPAADTSVGVADLAAALAPGGRALAEALPITAARVDAVRADLAAAGVDLDAATLIGPAWTFRTARGPRLVWRPARPAAARRLLDRAVRRYRHPGAVLAHEGAFVTVRETAGRGGADEATASRDAESAGAARARSGEGAGARSPGVTSADEAARARGGEEADAAGTPGRLVLRIGLVGRTLVAGRASASELRRIAGAPTATVAGGTVAVRLARRGLLPRRLTAALQTTPDGLTVRVDADG